MLHIARDMAVQANAGQTAFEAIDAMAENFHVDANAMKASVLAKFAASAKTAPQHKCIAEYALELANQTIDQNQFMTARHLERLALAEARKATDTELITTVQGQIAEAGERIKAREIALGDARTSTVSH